MPGLKLMITLLPPSRSRCNALSGITALSILYSCSCSNYFGHSPAFSFDLFVVLLFVDIISSSVWRLHFFILNNLDVA
jgi:hypothetical protein